MSYSFGGATSDRVAVTLQGSGLLDNGHFFLCGWWRPTTLTAGRGYWGLGATAGAEVDASTGEIRLRTDNTTDGQWVTSGAGIVTDVWHFLAFLAATENTTVAGAWRVWVGAGVERPRIITPTVSVARSGNYTGSGALVIGNRGANTNAFQGQISDVVVGMSAVVGITNFGRSAASGVITDPEAADVEKRLVLPFWEGRPPRLDAFSRGSSTTTTTVIHIPLSLRDPGVALQVSNSTTPTNPVSLTITGATHSEERAPIILPRHWLCAA